MEIFLVILSPCFIFVIFFIFMLIRNTWVLKQQLTVNEAGFEEYTRVLNNDPERYKSEYAGKTWMDDYWSYGKMLWHFWIWDVEKMKNNKG